MVTAIKYPPFVAASTWGTLVAQLWDMVQRKRGKHSARYPSAEGVTLTLAPRLTNADVVRFTMAWLAALTRTRARELFPLWHQFAAAAYGWNPATNAWSPSAKRAAALFPDVLLVEFWKALMALASDLDAERVANPRLDLDGEYADVAFQGEVKGELQGDGASASFKIPVPACKRPDGTTGAPRCKRYMKTWPYLCEEYEKCTPVVIKDPITDIHDKSQKALLLVALIVVAWWAYDSKPRRRRERE